MKGLIVCIFIIITAIIFIFYKTSYATKKNNIDCRASVTFLKGDEELKVYVVNTFNSGKGVISMNGILYTKNTKLYLSQTTGFDYIKVNDIFYMKSNKISKSPQATISNDSQKKWLPSFFLTENQVFILKVVPLSANKWTFSSGTTPLYLCERY